MNKQGELSMIEILLLLMLGAILATLIIFTIIEIETNQSPSDLACQKIGYDSGQDGFNDYCIKDNKYYPAIIKCDISMSKDRCRAYEIGGKNE